MTIINVYLNFDGQTKEAMEFYHGIFGGELSLQTFGEAYENTSESVKNRIIHANLKNDTLTFMASDTHPEFSPPHKVGNNVSLSINGSDLELLTEYFQKLAEGGEVTMPLEKQFWGDTFGSLTDKFGIHWMVNVTDA
ncbi:VOC family protein [Mangrovibacillus cuniculi]|uniref:VOC family protein n=1 Tax=Mangrovibacillus cuniculi TaxID=2593652 RepID=A0A7S8CD96_9BACI|nr:VOC family protein [Mangrovibacillus cuniculi]QPC47867.1 VOC family protein [Mangrovibacillus cuniculi]